MVVWDGAAAGAVWIGVGVFGVGCDCEGYAGFAVCVRDEAGGVRAGGDGRAVCVDAGGLSEVQQPEADLSADGHYGAAVAGGVCVGRDEWGASVGADSWAGNAGAVGAGEAGDCGVPGAVSADANPHN